MVVGKRMMVHDDFYESISNQYIGILWEDIDEYANLITGQSFRNEDVIKHYFDNLKPCTSYVVDLSKIGGTVDLLNWIKLAKPHWVIQSFIPIGSMRMSLSGFIQQYDGVTWKEIK